MSRATDLAAALRLCTRYNDSGCRDCQFNGSRRCVSTLKLTAANELEEMTDRCARYAEEIAVLQGERKRASAADVAPVVRGRWIEADWIEMESGGHELIRTPNAALRCSNCRCCFKKELLWKRGYCPNCGAKMDGGGEHEVR